MTKPYHLPVGRINPIQPHRFPQVPTDAAAFKTSIRQLRGEIEEQRRTIESLDMEYAEQSEALAAAFNEIVILKARIAGMAAHMEKNAGHSPPPLVYH